MQSVHRLAIVVVGSFCAALAAQASGQQYSITDIGTLPGFTGSQAFAISGNGQVAGTMLGGTANHAFLYNHGVITDIGANWPNQVSSGEAVNSNGQVAGQYYTGSTYHAFLYSNGTATDLGTLPNGTYSEAFGINDGGQVVGASTVGGSQSAAFIYSNGSMTNLTPGAFRAYASAINDSGIAVGAASGSSLYWQAFGPLPPHSDDFWTNTSVAYGISNTNQVVGAFGGTSLSHAFLYANGVVTDLGTLGGSTSEAMGVNDAGVVVGDSQFAANNTNTHAFVFLNGTMYDLNSLIPANSGWVLTNATGINDSGEIVGYGTNPSGQQDSVLLTPTPEPGTLAGHWLFLSCVVVFS